MSDQEEGEVIDNRGSIQKGIEKSVKNKSSKKSEKRKKNRQNKSRANGDEQNDSVTNSSDDFNFSELKMQGHKKSKKKSRARPEEDGYGPSKRDPYSSYRPSKKSKNTYHQQGVEEIGEQYQVSASKQMPHKKRDKKAFEKDMEIPKSNEL